ncbi:hypothetical protein PENSPDRAFT_656895 [Peniophora sp. CONT]|nr:hypothetical protein PENSPDRAFT_656895 [Peniophora sp. CONT]
MSWYYLSAGSALNPFPVSQPVGAKDRGSFPDTWGSMGSSHAAEQEKAADKLHSVLHGRSVDSVKDSDRGLSLGGAG